VISGDGHLEVSSPALANHLPAKYRDAAPELVRYEDGTDWWHMDGWALENFGNLVCDLDYDKFLPSTGRTYFNPDGSPRPGTGSPEQRLREQDLDGIDAEILYPPVFAAAFLRRKMEKDKEAYLAVVRAYNDFLTDDYCAIAPDRLIAVAVLPQSGLDDAMAELKRVRNKGVIGYYHSKWPSGGDYYSKADDNFFAAAVDMDMVCAPHLGWGAGSFPPDAGMSVEAAIGYVGGAGAGRQAPFNMSQLILNGVFDRIPRLHVYFAETACGWIPTCTSHMDRRYRALRKHFGLSLKKLPSEYFRDNAAFGFVIDRLAMKHRDLIGVDTMLWGSDLPHSTGTMPYTPTFLDDFFEGVPAEERRRVLVENPCRIMRLDPDHDITPTPEMR
jgi:predicted TIM-barrel fold metal-dependent hydrolase